MQSYLQPQKFYYDPYYLVNYLVFLSFIPVRLFLFPKDTMTSDGSLFSSRELQFYVGFLLLVAAKWRQSYNTQMFLSSIMTHCRCIILLISFLYYPRAMAWYIIPFMVFMMTIKRDTYRGTSRVSKITDYTFDEEIIKDFTDTKHLLFFYHPSHTLCQFVYEDYIDLSIKHANPKLKFHMIDVVKSPETMKRYNIRGNDPMPYLPTITIPSKQLPTILCFSRGSIQEEGQLPLLLPDNKIRPLTWSNMLTYFDLKDYLKKPREPLANQDQKDNTGKGKKSDAKRKNAKID